MAVDVDVGGLPPVLAAVGVADEEARESGVGEEGRVLEGGFD